MKTATKQKNYENITFFLATHHSTLAYRSKLFWTLFTLFVTINTSFTNIYLLKKFAKYWWTEHLWQNSACEKQRFYSSSKILHKQRSQRSWHFLCLLQGWTVLAPIPCRSPNLKTIDLWQTIPPARNQPVLLLQQKTILLARTARHVTFQLIMASGISSLSLSVHNSQAGKN